jgi:uncharacterized protein (TIGR00730 family)
MMSTPARTRRVAGIDNAHDFFALSLIVNALRRICIYAGSSPGARPEYAAAARELGTQLARAGLVVVYGGGNVGLMGVLADAAIAAGGEVIGVITHGLADKELAHGGATEMHRVGTMHERKWRMAELSDAFLALPGGFGTLEEFFEALTWLQLGLHRKPVGLLNVAGFYDPLLAVLAQMEAERFVRPEHRALVLVESDPASLLTRLAGFVAPDAEKWLDRVAQENRL